ncbi:DNA-3-methyladenine glycosylase [Herbiconiux moechotypicola]|uniref:Putative 3-methyladenine DNA glycosylase n=1 Tax=Herbiconiux moechotypicola TaxID=637393 RepID=A0ABP5QEH7_9MICO|nr:DNA-3-methyladenine glycosylase [Herbiconiux moechotypicola]MCS5729917.1 DNA-3-methyladenine glycosylase [Herbiconiux moechotypicola]
MTSAVIDLSDSALEVAPRLLGAVLSHSTAEGTVAVRLTEVEAYLGAGVDPGSHAFRGPTPRIASMYGPPGHLYTYFTYGMHVCANVVCSPVGEASAVLLRAGEVVEGHELARLRRPTARTDRDLARGPANLVRALGILLGEDGASLFAPPFGLSGVGAGEAGEPVVGPGPRIERSLRTGVSGDGGREPFDWRFHLAGEPSVSAYKRHPRA